MEEKINYRTIGVMITVCLLLLGYLVWRPEQGGSPAYVSAFITGKNSVRQIVKISIKTPDGWSIQYVKISGRWQIKEPYSAAASEPMIRELLDAVEKTRLMDIVEKEPETLSRYGLEEGKRIEAAFEFADGTARIFRIGERLPLNQIYVYFQRGEDSSVYRVWEGIRLTLEKHEAVLMQGKPVQFNSSTIDSLKVEHKGSSLYMEKRGGDWIMITPEKRAVDGRTVESYLESVLAITSSGAYPEDKAAGQKLNGSGLYKLTLSQGEGDEPMILRLTSEDALSPALLCIEQKGLTAFYATDPRFIDTLLFDPADFYLDKALFFDTDAISGIELLHPQYAFKLDRNREDLWRFHHPYDGQPADSDIVDQLLHLLGNMSVEHTMEDEEAVDSKVSPIVVKLSSNADFISLKIVETSAGHYRGTSGNHPSWYRLNADDVKRLEEFAPETLVDRHLLVFDPRSVEQVVVQRGGNEYVLTKKGVSWRWEKPQKKKAGSGMAWKLVFGIRDLQYQQPVGEIKGTGKGQNSCGIRDPDIVIRVKGGAEPGAEMVMKGTENGNELIISTSRFPGCYKMEKVLVDRILPDSAVFN